MPFFSFLIALARPLALKVLSSLGIGIISYAALNTVFNQLNALINSQIGGIAADFYGIAAIFGVFQSVSIIMSAISVKLGMTQLKRFGLL